MAGPGIHAELFPYFGQHNLELAGGDVATILSAPNWEDFWDLLNTSTDLGSVALGPELITASPDMTDVAGQREDQQARVDQVVEFSEGSETLFAFGSPTYGPDGQARNSLVFVRNGLVVAQTHKRYSMNLRERQTFSLGDEPEGLGEIAPMSALICSDVVGESLDSDAERKFMTENHVAVDRPIIGPDARTALISAWWGVPIIDIPTPTPVQERLVSQLNQSVEAVFGRHPQLEEVVIADRSGPPTMDFPLNAYFRRT